MKYVPKWNIERIVVADIKLEKFSDCQKQAADFTEKKLSHDKERTVLIDNISIPIGAYRIREKMKIVADVFTSVEVIKNSNYQNLKVYLNSPLFSDDDYDSICEYIVLNTGADCRKSFFINRVHGVLLKALCCLVCVFVVLLNIFKQSKRKISSADYLFNAVTSSDSSMDTKNKLSCAILSEPFDGKKLSIKYIINNKKIYKKWFRGGYDAINSIESMGINPSFSSIILGSFSAITDHANLNQPLSLFASIRVSIACKAIQNNLIKGYIFTNSNTILIPIEVLAFKALGKPTFLLNYSASFFHNVSNAYLLADTLLVWNENFANNISNYPQISSQQILKVGPFMFADEDVKRSKTPYEDKIVVGVYDVTPKAFAVIDDARITTNYSLEYYNSFMNDILIVMKNNAGIILKNKQKRIEVENNLTPEYMVTENPDKNPYQSIVDCDLIICMPFTSIYYAAELLGKPTIFYSGIKNLYFNGDPLIENKVVYGTDGLRRFMNKHLYKANYCKIDKNKVQQYANFRKPTKVVRSILFAAIQQ